MHVESARNDKNRASYVVESENSITSITAKLDLMPTRFCQINKFQSHHHFIGQHLKAVKEEYEVQKAREVSTINEEFSGTQADHTVTTATSLEKGYKHIFKRIIGMESVEKSKMGKITQSENIGTSDPLDTGWLKVEARLCHDLNTCTKGTLIATIETVMFSPLEESEQAAAFCQSPIEMRYESVRSVAAYHDASVFVFTKRPRLLRQCTHDSSAEETNQSTLSVTGSSSNAATPDEGERALEPLLRANEMFLCCTVQRNHTTSGVPTSTISTTPGARWFIVSRKSIEDLENFLTRHNLGFVSTAPMGSVLNKAIEGGGDRNNEEVEKSRNISSAIGSLIPRQMTLHFRGRDMSYFSRSLGRLMQRTGSVRRQNLAHDTSANPTPGLPRRPLSVGCSEELFCDHATIDVMTDSKKAGDFDDSPFFDSTSSTPSFADEKEVFDILRQSSLVWELVNAQEFMQRCVSAEMERERVGTYEEVESAIFTRLPLPTSLFQSCILTSQTQIQELFEAIPTAAQSSEWSLTFSTELHGFSLKTLYRRSEDFVCGDLHANAGSDLCYPASDFEGKATFSKHRTISIVQQNQPCVLLIKDTNDNLMGAYLSCHPRVSNGVFYGTGECFVFHWTPLLAFPCGEDILTEEGTYLTPTSGSLRFKKYPWSRKNSFFVCGESDVLIIGCSNASSALRIDESLNRGRSQTCETFDNPALTPSGDFFIHTFELWSLS